MDKRKTEFRKTAADYPQELLDMYDRYAHGLMSKRQFIANAAKYAVAGVSAVALVEQLLPNYALAQQVAPDDSSITTSRETVPSPNGHGSINGYLARPAGQSGRLPAVLVIHENRGLNPYIEDVARRMAKAGFMALAPDGLTSVGGYPGSDDRGRELQSGLDQEKLRNDFFASFEYLRTRSDCTGKVGAVGFCYGGGVVNALAVAHPTLSAGVPFYGRQPASGDAHRISAPLLLHYGELDTRLNEGWPPFRDALTAANKTFTAHIYPGANHGFHNDTTPRYAAAAARLAEERTLAFFIEHLR